jgi:type I restriction enzyme M protein
MLTAQTKSKINSARDILVGKIPDPKGQIDQITNALIYKFMDDQDRTASSLPGGKASFFVDEVEAFAWHKLFDKKLTNQERANLYIEGLEKLSSSTHLPELFQKIFKEAYLPFRDAGTIAMFLDKINEFDYNHSEELGNAFEYLLSVMGSQGDAGQFRTPRHIIKFIVDIIKPQPHESVIDPACGTAGFLVEAYNYIASNNNLTQSQKAKLADNLTGVDIDPGMAKIARVNLYLHGFRTPNITEDDTLTNPALWGTKYDVILANPPFMTPKGGIKPHDKFVKANKAEVLFTDYISEHLKLEGRAGIIVPEGIIFQSAKAYKDLRKKLIDDNYLLAVISLPSGVFQPYSGVKTSILILDRAKAKKSDSVLFIKIANDGFDLSAQRRENTKNDLPEALRLIENYESGITSETLPENVQIVLKAKLRESGDYNLSGDRYRANTDYSNSKYPIVELGKVVEFVGGYAFKSEELTKDNSSDTGLKVVKIGNVGKGGKVEIEDAQYSSYQDKLEKFVIKQNDILIAMTGATVGKIAISDFDNLLLNQRVGLIRPDKSKLSYYFLKSILFSDTFYDFCQLIAGGGAQGNISPGQIKSYKIPLPPLPIQEQIVAEISGYQKIIDGAKLITTNWKPRIDIDPSWEKVEIGNVAKVQGGYAFKSEDMIETNGVQIIKIGNVKDQNFDYKNNLSFVANQFSVVYADYTLLKNDILISMTGTAGKRDYGNVCLVDVEGKFLLNQRVGRVVPNSKVTFKYLFYSLLQDSTKDNFYSNTAGGARQGNISNKQIESIHISLPPTSAIQNEIVERIESERDLVESTKQLIDIYQAKIKSVIAKVWADVEN